MKKYYVILPNPNGEGNRVYGLVKTETMGVRLTRMGRKAFYFSELTQLLKVKLNKILSGRGKLDLRKRWSNEFTKT